MHSASSSNQSPVCQIELDDGLIDINKKLDGCQGQKSCSHMLNTEISSLLKKCYKKWSCSKLVNHQTVHQQCSEDFYQET